MKISIELIEAMRQQAQMMVAYQKALIAEGMGKDEALRMTIAYQGAHVKYSMLANIEQQKIDLEKKSKVVN